jgi:hypothetical protein
MVVRRAHLVDLKANAKPEMAIVCSLAQEPAQYLFVAS